jgi:hypothetical protein
MMRAVAWASVKGTGMVKVENFVKWFASKHL